MTAEWDKIQPYPRLKKKRQFSAQTPVPVSKFIKSNIVNPSHNLIWTSPMDPLDE